MPERFFGNENFLFTPDIGRFENQGDLEYFPSIYASINSGTHGLDAIRPDGGIIPSVFSPAAITYTSDSWSNTNTAIEVKGSSTYDLYISGSDINTARGTFVCLYRPDYAYNDSSIAKRYIVSGTNFLRIYYDYAEEAFYGQMYSGSGWDELVVSGGGQRFPSGSWIQIALTYDNTKGLFFSISGTMTDSKSTVWDAETAPTNLSIGYISGSDINSGDGAFDDIRMYKQFLTSAELYGLSQNDVGLN
jgi:hypothetical protein